MKFGIKYNEATGEIVMGISSSDPTVIGLQAEPGFPAIETAARVDNAVSYVAGGEVVDRPQMALVVGPPSFAVGSIFRVDGIPAGTVLKHPGGTTTIDDGYFEWSSAAPGQFSFSLQNFPYQVEEIHAQVTAV